MSGKRESVRKPFKVFPLFFIIFSLTGIHVCINHDPGGNEFGGIDTIWQSQILHVLYPHQDNFGNLYLACGSRNPFLRSRDGTDWIFAYHACDFDTSLRLLFEHLEGKSDPAAGIIMHFGYCNWCCVICLWNRLSRFKNYREFEVK
ncbi:hypothetical protein NE237_003879 [Protea cynaroides]|uniref:Uncharacterized protein n=1 Tax=Protea cynaroides TaxID=273540 RepID=A0A9Q0QSV0_9MAGN|nr:hypothetical protein NE237_003879 [Protea cynaroides]